VPRHFNNGGWFALLLNDLTVIVNEFSMCYLGSH